MRGLGGRSRRVALLGCAILAGFTLLSPFLAFRIGGPRTEEHIQDHLPSGWKGQDADEFFKKTTTTPSLMPTPSPIPSSLSFQVPTPSPTTLTPTPPPSEEVCTCNPIPDIDFLGGDLSVTSNVKSAVACCTLCLERKGCRHWTLDGDMCYLKGRHVARVNKKGLWSGKSCHPTESPTLPPPPPSREHAQASVKRAFLHAWNGYADRCFGQDEVAPIAGQCRNWLGEGLTIIDALSTMHVMGLTKEIERVTAWVNKSLTMDTNMPSSFFETVIRFLGGLISAYDFSGEKLMLNKAVTLAEKMEPAWHHLSGLPMGTINLRTGATGTLGWSGGNLLLAEVGTIQMEFSALSERSGDPKYQQKARKVVDTLAAAPKKHKGLYPTMIDFNSGHFKNYQITLGGCGDSFYEYLLKVWLLTGKKDERLRELYLESIAGIREKLIQKTNDGLTYVATMDGDSLNHQMEHLACFLPGTIALGAASGAVENKNLAAQHLDLAKELTKTCYTSYERQSTGIGPERMTFYGGNMAVGDPPYNMRPETVESIFYMWRITKDPIYRDWAWKIFLALEDHCKVQGGGYVGLSDVRYAAAPGSTQGKLDKQESFFLAETLKYLYLIFSDDSVLYLKGVDDKVAAKEGAPLWVINTEAHPIKAWSSRN